MSLRDELQAVYESTPARAGAEAWEVMQRNARELAASGLAESALGVGDQAPRFTLPSADGRSVALNELLASGPVVLTFYRGGWCPYCNLALRALSQHLDAITDRGARLVAISPQIPDESLSLVEKHQLRFDVLSDGGSDTAKRFGIAFDLSDELAALYDRFGFDLQRVNGGHARTLPLPATYVIDRDGVIRWAFVNTDYTARAEPEDVVAALDALPTRSNPRR